MNENNIKFGIKIDKFNSDRWSIGVCLSHWLYETYLYINLFKWAIGIGMIDREC